ncbi:venom allergen 3 homolog [Choristoneura fumiferana]|uniref:venom allergen 3 homolog n=1 Tax=Choristoneura fumiferana TaxID=7141 RepID=UPI003D15BA9E
MINVKLLVLFLCTDYIREICAGYCEICPKHTLCMYKNPGPNRSCKFYDKAALLTKDDAQNIVSKINQRRNFVALGLARNLPSAANMNKVEWSEELAMFAQRWVDQCDGVIRPDREDFCRDLADTKVGQNIATVTGYSPGLNVKSFVEIWFIQALDYTGSVTYYNESRESKTNYFTQLIWAATRLVGCGKARFSIDDKGTMVDRLVCNFAPRGNIQGKPVYTIGYPATQCKDDFQGDESFTGLCRPMPTKSKVPETTLPPAVSSLLRILNPPNRLIKHDNIDPIQNDAKDEESTDDGVLGIGHQKIRHAPNQTHLIQHEVSPNLQNTHAVTNNPLRHDAIPYHHTIDHLQNIHGAVYKTKSSTEPHRRHGYIKDFNLPTMVDKKLRQDIFQNKSLILFNQQY